MKALAVFPQSREVRLIDAPGPAIAGPTDVKLRILEAGDLRYRPRNHVIPVRHTTGHLPTPGHRA